MRLGGLSATCELSSMITGVNKSQSRIVLLVLIRRNSAPMLNLPFWFEFINRDVPEYSLALKDENRAFFKETMP